MNKVTLNSVEAKEYNDMVVNRISTILPGTYYFRFFFKDKIHTMRIAEGFMKM